MKLVSSEVSECADALQEKALQLMEVEHLQGYLTWLKRIIELRYGSVEEGGRGGKGREREGKEEGERGGQEFTCVYIVTTRGNRLLAWIRATLLYYNRS